MLDFDCNLLDEMFNPLTTRDLACATPEFPCPAVEWPTRTSGGKRSAMTGFLSALLRMCLNPMFELMDAKILGLLSKSGGWFYPRGSCWPLHRWTRVRRTLGMGLFLNEMQLHHLWNKCSCYFHEKQSIDKKWIWISFVCRYQSIPIGGDWYQLILIVSIDLVSGYQSIDYVWLWKI